MNKSRFEIAKIHILSYLDSQGANVYSVQQIEEILNINREKWNLPKGLTVDTFIRQLLEEATFKEITIEVGNSRYNRYVWSTPSIYKLAYSIKKRVYFSHNTALHLNKLTKGLPNVIYVNQEQAPKQISAQAKLLQEDIDLAFTKPQRVSSQIGIYENHKIYLLNGKYTGSLGVKTIKAPDNEEYPATDIERTLIDITVRPTYAGGVSEVLEAYKNAYKYISIKKLSEYLKKLNFIYPYHQSVGSYLEKAGYPEDQFSHFLKYKMKYDFYLTHNEPI